MSALNSYANTGADVKTKITRVPIYIIDKLCYVFFTYLFAARAFYNPPRATDDHSARVILIPQPLLAAQIMGRL